MAPLDLLSLFRCRGSIAYEGEGVSQWTHAFQCGQLAVAGGATAALELAAWLHDVGHLTSGIDGSPTLHDIEDGHEYLAAAALQDAFGDAVAGPVSLHVMAKRYLVAVCPTYRLQLSADSRRSLRLQGGPLSGDDLHAFRRHPFAEDALRLRLWDDQAKRPDCRPVSEEAAFAHLAALMDRVRSNQSQAPRGRGL